MEVIQLVPQQRIQKRIRKWREILGKNRCVLRGCAGADSAGSGHPFPTCPPATGRSQFSPSFVVVPTVISLRVQVLRVSRRSRWMWKLHVSSGFSEIDKSRDSSFTRARQVFSPRHAEHVLVAGCHAKFLLLVATGSSCFRLPR